MVLAKALLTVMGLGSIPSAHNKDVHDAVNLRSATLSAQTQVTRLQRVIARAEAQGKTDLVERATRRQSEVRRGLEDLTRRLG